LAKQGITRWEFQAGVFAAALIVGILSYIAYRKSFFPFTADTKKKIHDLLYGPTPPAPEPTTVTICADGSTVNPSTGLCRNGAKPVQVATAPAGAPGTVPNPLQDIITPQGGTGAVSLKNDQAVANPYGLYCRDGTNPDPTTQLCDDGSQPGAKPDQNVEAIFQQEMYKQLFLPYQKYPYLYGPNYLQALMPKYGAACQDGSSPSPTSGLCANGAQPVPNPGDIQNLAQNPYASVFGTLPPIQGGDIPPQTQDQQVLAYYQQQQLQQTYGLFPPGGYTPNPQTTAPLPGTPSSENTGLGSVCFTDNVGIQWCPSPTMSANTPGCTTIQGVVYCNNATQNTGVGSGQVPQGCFTVGNQMYCKLADGNPSNPPAGCITDGTNVYCQSGVSVPTNPGGTSAGAGQCFQLGGVTYCQSAADPSTPGCTTINGNVYCAIAGPSGTTTPPTGTPGTPTTQDCFTDNKGVQFCACDQPVTGSVQAGGQLYCPQGGGAGACFTGSDGVTRYCPCTTATQGAIYANNQLYCVAAPETPPTPPPTTTPAPPAIPTCPAGYNYDSQHDVCVQIPTTGQPSCPTGDVWDPTLSICHIQCASGFFFDPSIDTCRGSCPSGTSWDPTTAACVAPQPPPSPPPSPPPTSTINCSSSGAGCCNSSHKGNCHSECCWGKCMSASSCTSCLDVCGSYEGECSCSHSHYAHAKAKHAKAMSAWMTNQKKAAYEAISDIADEKRALARASLTKIEPYITSAVAARDLPRGGSWRISRS